MREVPAREVFLDEFFTELSLHERIRRDLPDESGRLVRGAVAFHREVEEALHERHGERVLAVARGESRAVELADGFVFDGDVGRIADDGVVLLPENTVQGFNVLDLVVVLEFVAENRVSAVERALWAGVGFKVAKTPPMEQRVPHREIETKVGGRFQPVNSYRLQRADQQSEPSNPHSERVADVPDPVFGSVAGNGAQFGTLNPDGRPAIGELAAFNGFKSMVFKELTKPFLVGGRGRGQVGSHS